MRFGSGKGSVLMEFVLVGPMLLLLIFVIVQLAFIFMARQLVFYAAYSAARTALVYNIKDYTVTRNPEDEDASDDFRPNSGPLYLAACTVMSWLNFGDGSSDFPFYPKGDADVWWQVRISGKERIVQEGKDRLPAVAVTVHYYYPLMVPLVGDMLAYVLAGPEPDDSTWETFGWAPGPRQAAAAQNIPQVTDAPRDRVYRNGGLPVLHLQETCYMAKPYKTSTYARIPTDGSGGFQRSL
ncbi:MAG: pilus assembly protein [Lentisphaeria bacterium]|nr:pilus assembly protein [Lentisphaeria bacterium]